MTIMLNRVMLYRIMQERIGNVLGTKQVRHRVEGRGRVYLYMIRIH